MAITYKDISQLTQKSSVAGTEKLPVSDTQYITPNQISSGSLPLSGGTMTGDIILPAGKYIRTGVGSGPTIGYDANYDLYVGDAQNQTNTYIAAGGDLYHDTGGSNVKILDAGNYDSYALPLSGGTLTGTLTMPNNNAIQCKDTGGTARTVLSLGSTNKVWVAYGAAGAGYDTTVCGNNITFQYGTSHTTGFTLDSSGNVAISGVTTITKDTQQPLVVKRDAAGSTQYAGIGYQTSDTNLGAIGMNGVGEAFVRSGSASTYYRVYTSKNITISSSDPTSGTGSDGDIWIKI